MRRAFSLMGGGLPQKLDCLPSRVGWGAGGRSRLGPAVHLEWSLEEQTESDPGPQAQPSRGGPLKRRCSPPTRSLTSASLHRRCGTPPRQAVRATRLDLDSEGETAHRNKVDTQGPTETTPRTQKRGQGQV